MAKNCSMYRSPECLFIIIAFSITLAEFCIMVSFRFFPHFSPVVREAIDSALILAISFPVIYFFVYRPLRFQITERERAKRDWEVTFDSIKDPLCLHDNEYRIVRVNKAYRDIAGIPFKDIIGKPYYDVFPKMSNPFRSCTGSLELREEEITLSNINKIFRVRFYPLSDTNKHDNNSIHLFEDITEKKRMENELKIKILELKRTGEMCIASEEKFRQIADHVNEVFWMTSIDGKEIIYVSPAYEKIWGRTCKSLYDDPLDWINTIHPEDRERVKTAFFEVVKEGKYDEEYRIVLTDKSIRWIHARGFPVKNEAGEIYRLVGVAEEVTDKKRTEEEIKKLNSLLLSIRHINEALLKVKNEADLFNKICSSLLNTGFVKFAWIGLVENEGSEVKPVAWAGLDNGYLSFMKVKLDDPVYGSGPAGVAIKTGEPVFIKDVENDHRYKLMRRDFAKRGFVSSASIPLRPEEKTIGILNIYSDRKDAFGEEETKYLVQVAGDIGIGYKSLMLEKKLKQSIEDFRISLNSTIEAISLMSEVRDPYTAGHEKRVAQLACAIAKEIGFVAERIEGIRVSAYLHDIGKVAVPAEILSKPTALSEHEYGIIKTHPRVGFDILKNLKFSWPVAQTTLQHHEMLNGSGYPSGLQGEEILMESRILAVADVVEAMTSHRPYRPALGLEKALEEITRNKGVFYDPRVVDACLKLFQEKGFRFLEEA